jgi:hypothetical protein
MRIACDGVSGALGVVGVGAADDDGTAALPDVGVGSLVELLRHAARARAATTMIESAASGGRRIIAGSVPRRRCSGHQ